MVMMRTTSMCMRRGAAIGRSCYEGCSPIQRSVTNSAPGFLPALRCMSLWESPAALARRRTVSHRATACRRHRRRALRHRLIPRLGCQGFGPARGQGRACLELRAYSSVQLDRNGHSAHTNCRNTCIRTRCDFRPVTVLRSTRLPDRLTPRSPINVTVHRASGESTSFATTAAVETGIEVEILRIGGIIPFILRRALDGGADIGQQQITGDGESIRRHSSSIYGR